MSPCSGCVALPAGLPADGHLFLSPPLGHSLAKLSGFLEAAGLEANEPCEGVVALPMETAGLSLLQSDLGEHLSDEELEDTRAIIVPKGHSLSISDLMHTTSLASLLARVRESWLVDMLRENRLQTFFQPIVDARSGRDVFAYECLLRGVDTEGQLVGAPKLYDTARRGKLLFQLDRSARLCHINSAIRHGLTTNVFINFNPTAIYDPIFCLRSTVDAIRQSTLPAESFVFEVVESEEIHDTKRLLKIFEYYRDRGFRVALDDLGAGYSSLSLLSLVKPDFIKLDMQLVFGVDEDPYKGQIAAKLLEMARSLGVKTIAEGVETVGQWQWLTEHGADYLQGYLFGRPDPLPQVPGAPELVATS